MENILRAKCKSSKPLLREFLAEFLGTFVLVVSKFESAADFQNLSYNQACVIMCMYI